MRTKRVLALTLAGVMAAGLLCGCPWQDAPSSSSSSSSTTTRPTGSGSDSDDDDTSDDDDSKETTYTDNDGNKITEGNGFIRTETSTGKISYTVTNAAGLVKWGTEVRDGNRGIDCTLENNIDMTGVDWIPIGTRGNADGDSYQGTFDGNGHSISNLTVHRTTGDCGGLFGIIELGCVKNLTLSNADITAGNNTGGITGMLGAGSQITGCTVTGSTITATTNDAGGIVGILASGGEVIGCMVSNSTIRARDYAGGIVGSADMDASEKITACCFVGNGDKNENLHGGIVGGISLGSDSSGTFQFNSCYWSTPPENVAYFYLTDTPTDPREGSSRADPQGKYSGALKIGSIDKQGIEVTWARAVNDMNNELQSRGYEYRYSGNPPQLGPANGASLLADHFGLSLPF